MVILSGFFHLKVLKPDRRTWLHTGTLSDLLDIRVEGPPLASFSADEHSGGRNAEEQINQERTVNHGKLDHQVQDHLQKHVYPLSQMHSIYTTGPVIHIRFKF